MLPKEQLKTWAHQGSTHKSKNTYEIIKKSLQKCNKSYCNDTLKYDIYLQGSYKNSTHINESDIDVVVQLNSVYLSNLPKQKFEVDKAHDVWFEFRQCVLEMLQEEFTNFNVIQGNKSIKIDTSDELVSIDVVPSLQYRKYSENQTDYLEGFTFWHNSAKHQIIHYPKKHYVNGVRKNQVTKANYKSVIRIFKNIRKLLIRENALKENESSSYFTECLLYNLPNGLYGQDYKKTLKNISDVLMISHIDDFSQQHGDKDFKLFGEHPEQWNTESARIFIKEINKFIKNEIR